MIRIGCAGWSLPTAVQDQFGEGASHLQRYATRFGAAEINSSFHRSHRSSLYERWAQAVPEDFRFCAKLPKTITHERRLVDTDDLLRQFLDESAPLGEKLACLLVQLPPSLSFDAAVARTFFDALRTRFVRHLAVEPRHESWMQPEADALLASVRAARVLADPVRHAAAVTPGGWPNLVYLRLHGSPRVYYSSYEPELIERLAHRLELARQQGHEAWCIFDNTASGAATANALQLRSALERLRAPGV